MDPVIYSVSPMKAFAGEIFLIVFLFVLGLVSAFSAIAPSRRPRNIFSRIATGAAALILILAGGVMVITTYHSYQNGDKTVQVRVSEKNEVTRRCNDVYCTDYMLDTTDGRKLYAFGVKKDIWNVIEVNGCYQFTFYPAKPLLGDTFQSQNDYPSLYETTGEITKIEKVNCP